MSVLQPKTALLSVSDKTGIAEFAQGLHQQGVKILSTGGTAKAIEAVGIPITKVSDVTGVAEMMDGRVKTLHPTIHGGILGRRDQHAADAKDHGIEWIDLVVVNLYPFAQTIAGTDDFDQAIENIDIGGPAMVRAAAKNLDWVSVVVNSADYQMVLDEIAGGGITQVTRKALSAKAFAHTANYDALIAKYLNEEKFPQQLALAYERQEILRYGKNPHQQAALYRVPLCADFSLMNAQQHQGKPLSYNNMVDAQGALDCLSEFDMPACVVVKHANPCGVAQADTIEQAFEYAWHADNKSAFGGIVALNRTCNKTIAQFLSSVFVEIVIAPKFDDEALACFAQKPNLRVLDLGDAIPTPGALCYKFLDDGLLVQDRDNHSITSDHWELVSETQPDAVQIGSMLFAWKVVKHIKSNGILLAKGNVTTGVGAGQVSRVDAVELAISKAGAAVGGSVLASDAFFPFRDSIDLIAQAGIKAIIQPGGSIRDAEVIDACNEHKIAMVLTKKRCFNH